MEEADVLAGTATVFLFGERPLMNRSRRCSLSVSEIMQGKAHTG